MNNNGPFTHTPVTIIEGEPRSGKTNTAVARLVDAIKKDSALRIFCNFKLYGIKYVFADLGTIVEYLNSGLLRNGYIVIDEAYIGMDARDGMAMLTKIMSYLGLQAGKRRLHLIIIMHHGRMMEWRINWLAYERIHCSYNATRRTVTLRINKRGERRERMITYDAWPYWKYYDTEEIMAIPESKLAKALLGAR